jgi:hypothetical protein
MMANKGVVKDVVKDVVAGDVCSSVGSDILYLRLMMIRSIWCLVVPFGDALVFVLEKGTSN